MRYQYGWHVRAHRAWRDRREGQRHDRVIRNITDKHPREADVRIASLNIASVSGKREELGYMMREERIDILALQETRVGVSQWRIRVPGYQNFFSLASDDRASNGLASARGKEPGRNGMALLVNQDITAYEVGKESGYWIFIRISGGPLLHHYIIGNIYRPHDKEVAKEMMEGVKKQVSNLRNRFPDDPIIIAGDWNLKGHELDKITGWQPGMLRVKMEGEARTFKRGKYGDIDHMMVDIEHDRIFQQMGVCRRWDISDHWMIMGTIAGTSFSRPPSQLRERMSISRSKKGKGGKSNVVGNHNYWMPLCEKISENVMEEDKEGRIDE
jgi:exonuclease III